MKAVTAEEIQHIDRHTIEQLGVPGEILMAYAGKAVADFIMSIAGKESRIAVFCGTGNNGGDGFVIAYWLFNNGYNIDIFLAGPMEKISVTSRIYFNICRKMNLNIIIPDKDEITDINTNAYDLLVDALLGTGFKGSPKELIKDCIIKINNSGKKIISVDLPSGLPSNSEAPEGEVVKADHTVTIGLPKISLVTFPGKQYTGILHIADIGFPKSLTGSEELRVDLLDKYYIRSRLNLKRDADSHKGNTGHILFIGGFDNMEGAIMMSVMAAIETGAGLATLLTTGASKDRIAGKIPELMTRSFSSSGSNIKNELKKFLIEDRNYNAVVIGPGMGRTELSRIFFSGFIENLKDTDIKNVLIDGDGLFHLAEYLKNNSLPDNKNFIITPHFGEASRLLNKSADEIKNNRLQAAKELAKKTSAITLLKGPSTIITDSVNSLINTTGSEALATGGSGDVLSGIIGAMLLKDLTPLDTAGIGAYIHGLAGDIFIEDNQLNILKATDIINKIRKAIQVSLQNSPEKE